MASIGTNVARDGSHDPNVVRSFGFTWQRIVALPDLDLSVHFRNCRQAGLKTLLVLARESAGDYARYNRLYGSLVDAVQVGNEPDLESPSSWTMTQGELVALGKAARSAFGPTMPLVCAGVASGHPEWLDGMDLSWCDAIAVQPYLKDAPNPDDLEDLPDVDVLVRAYQRFGKPVIVSEWGWWSDQEPRASEETRDMLRWAGRTGDAEVFFWFCLSDSMVPPFGLLDAKGKPKPRAAVVKEQAPLAIHSLWPNVTPEQPEPPTIKPWAWWTPEALAQAAACPLDAVRENWPRLVEQMTHAGIYSRMVAIAMIGTIAKESASTFRPVREGFYLGEPEPAESYRKTLRYYPYYGRGFIQNTWEDAYRELGPKIAQLWGAGGWEPDFDLVNHPDNLLDPDLSAAAAAIFFRDAAGGALLLAARNGQWDQVRRYVLGGPDPEGTARIARIATALGTTGPDVPVTDPKDELIRAYEIALRTLRDETLPSLELQLSRAEAQLDAAQAMLDEAKRITVQMVGAA